MYPERLWLAACGTVQVDTVIELCQQALAAGQCPVIGLQSTGEARTAAYVKAAQQSKQRGTRYRFVGRLAMLHQAWNHQSCADSLLAHGS